MSIDIRLCRLSDAKVVNKGLYFVPPRILKTMDAEEFGDLYDCADADRFDDGIAHELIDITYYKWCYGKTRGWKNVRNKFNRLPIQACIVDGTNCIHKHIVADCMYRPSSRHVLNRRYYKKDTWLVLCTTKDEVIRFFERYGDKKYNEYKYILNNILEKWDDKSFLIVAW